MYADDIAIVYGEKDERILKQKIQEDLLALKSWLDQHFMSMNVSKTKYVIFIGRKHPESLSQQSFTLMHDGELIERVNCFKYLGLFIDEKLSFHQHLAHIRSKVIPMAFAIRRIHDRINEKTAVQLYFAHIYSHLIFMNPIWTAANKEKLNEMFIVQKKALKFAHKKPMLTPSIELFSEKILPLPVMSEYLLLILAFKLKHNMIKNSVEIKYVSNVHAHSTRQSENFYVQPYETRFGQADFYYRGLSKFNELPEEIKRIRSMNVFKTRIRKYLYDKFVIDNQRTEM